MKNFMLTLTLAFLSLTVTIAQEQRPGRQVDNPEERARMEVQRLHKDLDLSQTQQDSILNYLLTANKEQQQLRKQSGGDRQAAFEKMRAQREVRTAKIKSYLTSEQVGKYEDLLKKRQENRSQQRKNNL
ncbi:hypothetical protein G5B00_02155 [Parapedobacter sp. SGR-10]|uniref:hypothetical protein n=1 Tax=Parapedobacter sp. SGR-10 TaxID=2710879 RepID=UPI0013D826A5|nr:hypothetical protein [Parapedobacter sp. SGR-10]NGF55303.1 hypothetical protein [Parapedobacter sp. SGR-10]